jgi:phosphatidylserine/phosphatidylglycerophosphate/cardiolipin synthase-like enzyme
MDAVDAAPCPCLAVKSVERTNVRDGRLLIPGQACWRVERADQFAIHGADPTGSVPHQKIAVIDDTFALCGGIDFTGDRWDTREHKHRSRFRRVLGRSYGPRHEVAAAVDGAATRAVGELAPIDAAHVVWPRGLEPILHDIDVVIDDRLLRVGSTNLNKRSMGFDSECDLAIEADANTPEHDDVRRKITSHELVSEHPPDGRPHG